MKRPLFLHSPSRSNLMVKVFPKTSNRNGPIKKLIPFSLYNRSPTYRRLPEQQFLNLSVHKLDGSSFSLNVARNATVAELKFAVEEAFNQFPDGDRTRLWALVWSHFCLCYEGQKLIHDVACIKKYGIKDGDQLRFIQHLRVDLAPTPEAQAKDRRVKSKHGSTCNDGSEELRYLLQQPKPRLKPSFKRLLSCSNFRDLK
ncbi:hypothetical protein SASPL_108013 [Salvia splendens]|uniref:Ubiquitin-like domain-containing protein n=1 Tax=Salvia splendens TaxID=180675 RepID=A0A8X9A718_SALSN|nr:uncharacterized protein LOC121795043 [Salvia splendens]KAG6429956.1 hypothetical protein SASPL_108013 [Salvia splendens]